MNTKKYITTVELTPDGDAYILLPPELLYELGWDEHTRLDWRDSNGSIVLSKIPRDSKDTHDT